VRYNDTKTSYPQNLQAEVRKNNLWKYNLPNAWRLVYSISGSEVEIIAILLEWFPHKEYERRFKY
jgi:hypothetical protein